MQEIRPFIAPPSTLSDNDLALEGRGLLMVRAFVIALCLATLAGASFAEVLTVKHRHEKGPSDARNAYFLQVLELALEKTAATDGPYKVEKASFAAKLGDSLTGVEEGLLDVDWRMTTAEREERFLPVRIPLLKGLSGYRVLLIREEEQGSFDSIESLKELAPLKAGLREGWADIEILKSNGLKTVEVPAYESLFFLLKNNRFDYFPRNVSEVLDELEEHGDKGIALEKKLLLHYPSAVYFFVKRDNTALAERLGRGLEMAIKDGSFQKTFNYFPAHRTVLEKLPLHSRRVIRLENPLLPDGTPIDRAELWLNGMGLGK